MSKIAMFTMGTRGDVQPYIFLSKQLIKNAHAVTLGSHPCWRKLVEDAGIHFEPIGPDIDIEKEAAVIRGKNSNPVMSMLKTMNFVFRIIQNSSKEIYEVCKKQNFIIVSHSQMGAVEAGVLGIPTVNVTIQKEMIGEKLKPKTFKDKLIGGMIEGQAAKPYNKIRKIYGLKPVKSADEIMSKDLNLIPISKQVLPRNPYWEEKNVLTGYWYDEEPNFVPDERLVDYKLPDTMIAWGSVPHSWLFQHAKFVIHHCGFGTSAATLIYGIPSIPVPHVLDQLGFATQLSDNQVATKPLKSKDLSEQKIIEAIEEMNRTYAEKKQKAIAISEKIREENGVVEAARLIEKVMKKYGV